jgi:serine/threonine protein kinase
MSNSDSCINSNLSEIHHHDVVHKRDMVHQQVVRCHDTVHQQVVRYLDDEQDLDLNNFILECNEAKLRKTEFNSENHSQEEDRNIMNNFWLYYKHNAKDANNYVFKFHKLLSKPNADSLCGMYRCESLKQNIILKIFLIRVLYEEEMEVLRILRDSNLLGGMFVDGSPIRNKDGLIVKDMIIMESMDDCVEFLVQHVGDEDRHLPSKFFSDIVYDILTRIQILHRKGMYYTDLKNDNILYKMIENRKAIIKLCDYGGFGYVNSKKHNVSIHAPFWMKDEGKKNPSNIYINDDVYKHIICSFIVSLLDWNTFLDGLYYESTQEHKDEKHIKQIVQNVKYTFYNNLDLNCESKSWQVDILETICLRFWNDKISENFGCGEIKFPYNNNYIKNDMFNNSAPFDEWIENVKNYIRTCTSSLS